MVNFCREGGKYFTFFLNAIFMTEIPMPKKYNKIQQIESDTINEKGAALGIYFALSKHRGIEPYGRDLSERPLAGQAV